MKNKKIFVTIFTMLIVTILLGTFMNVQAAEGSKWFNITMSRKFGFGYQLSSNRKNIWKIYDESNLNKDDTIYCLRGGPGFGSADMSNSSIQKALYEKYFDLKKKEEIGPTYLAALSNIQDYNGLIWALENCYVPAKTNASTNEKSKAEENKKILLNAVIEYATNVNNPNLNDIKYIIEENLINDDDIDAVQQLVVWYYTNPNSLDPYHTEKEFEIWMNKVRNVYTADTYIPMSNTEGSIPSFPYGLERLYTMQAIFEYLTQTPKQPDFTYNYKNQNIDIQNVIDKQMNIKIETNGDRLIVGPYKINEIKDIEYLINLKWFDKINNQIVDVKYLDNNKQPMESILNDKELVGKIFYVSVPNNENNKKIELRVNGTYFDTLLEYWSVANPGATDQPIVIVKKVEKNFNDSLIYEAPVLGFDLALRKYITEINGISLSVENTRIPNIEESTLTTSTTATYKHRKDPVVVKTGDKVKYKITIYNEGEKAGRATKVIDQLPRGLKFVKVVSGNFEKESYNENTDNKLVLNRIIGNNTNLPAYVSGNIQSETIEIECEVTALADEVKDKVLTNIAYIAEEIDVDGNIITNQQGADRDSEPLTNPEKNKDNMENYSGNGNKQQLDDSNYFYKGQQDDDDFEKLILKAEPKKPFDLSLRKFITEVEDKNGIIKKYERIPKVDVTKLKTGEATTAIYNHTKDPVSVSTGNIVTYTIRVYNEGEVDGYVNEITDHLPPQLEFLENDELNAKYAWKIVPNSKGRKVYTDITSKTTSNSANRDLIYKDRNQNAEDKVLLKAFDGNGLDYIDVKIRCKVKENINLFEKITNIAEITKFTDKDGNVVTDRDSQENNVVVPDDKTLPNYKDVEIENKKQYIEGQQDDDDFEKLEVKRFDLALRKFITGVISGDKKTEIKNRVPVFTKTEDGRYVYEHTKEPVEVANANTVIYTLRIFNEGNIAGYAEEIKDNIPDGLVFLPENEINTAYRWKMYKEDGITETKDVKEAKIIKTDYLSKKQDTKGDKLIQPFNPENMDMPDYKDVKVAFKVTEPNTSDRIIINIAEITEDADKDGKPVEDVDSTPNNDEEKEDDIDIEKIKVKYFDLSLKKWVTESIVTYNGKTTVTKTGHTGDENPEAPAKVDLHRRKIDKTTVKFRFNIKVTNEGEIAGYVKELIDYIPEGLKFDPKDNPNWREENGKVLTNQLKDKLLQPGESATVEIVLTWINDKENMGLKENWAEIYEDDNEPKSPDIDSTPGNNIKGEDDIDKAPVILSIITGGEETYIILTLTCITLLTTGIVLIKKFVI